jgi:O-acetylserine/cysteine efflux transporter
VLAAAASWGLGNVVTRIARPSSGLRLVVWASLVPPIPLALLSLAVDGPAADAAALRSLDLHGVAALAYLVVLATLLGHGLWTSLLRWYPATTVAPFSLLVPVVGVSAAWLLLGERPSATELVGSVVVLVAIATLALAGGPRPAPAPAAPVELDAEATVS